MTHEPLLPAESPKDSPREPLLAYVLNLRSFVWEGVSVVCCVLIAALAAFNLLTKDGIFILIAADLNGIFLIIPAFAGSTYKSYLALFAFTCTTLGAFFNERLHLKAKEILLVPSSLARIVVYLKETIAPRAIAFPLFVLSGLLYLCFLFDRTQLFSADEKTFNWTSFTFLNASWIIVGLCTLEKIKDSSFLNRHQTNEWKGWMQLAILVYHYCGASKKLEIYTLIRCCVASYLFMTGFGHFSFFYSKANFGIARILKVVVRLNLLSLSLCYVMGNTLLFYYFGPLVTFWFLVVYVTMYIRSDLNQNLYFLIPKIIAMMAVTYIIINVPEVLGGLFFLLNNGFGLAWDPVEFAFRLRLDQWIVYIGMFSALAVKRLKEPLHSLDDRSWRKVQWAAIITSIGLCVFYILAELMFDKKAEYNEYHSILSIFMLLGFIILRNSTPTLRSYTSSFWCWIGTFSLETFLLQYHMWLADDTKKLLVIIPGHFWLNFILITIPFLYFSEKLGDASGKLVDWIVCKDVKTLGIRFGIIAATLLLLNLIPLP